MTVSYAREMATRQKGGFLRFLFRIFETMSKYFEFYSSKIPLSFMLGFYVTIIVKRFYEQYQSLPWPDTLALYVSTYIQQHDPRSQLIKRTIMRYANAAFVMTLRNISPVIKEEFPSLEKFVTEGLLTKNERAILEDIYSSTTHAIYWVPMTWASTMVLQAQKDGRIHDGLGTKTIMMEIARLRSTLGTLLGYDTINISLVYTQVVTIAVYTFFLSALMGRQFLHSSNDFSKDKVHFIVPIFTYLQFFFYMGWLKVAESLINPFGADDDDFEISRLIKRNIEISYMYVEQRRDHPEMLLSEADWQLLTSPSLGNENYLVHEKPNNLAVPLLDETLTENIYLFDPGGGVDSNIPQLPPSADRDEGN